ncbi:MAG: TROVE domain-containing protein, partial [Chitinophagaceae bacterium]
MEAQQTPKFTQIFTELFEFQQERVVQVTALKKYRNVQNVSTPASNRQVKNNTGGFVFEVSDQSRLERFLILGTDGGTYYVNEEDLTQQNVSWLEGLIRRDWALVLNTVSDVSINGRAYRNSAAIFVLALVLNVGSDEAKAKVVELTPIIARTATHVYELATY